MADGTAYIASAGSGSQILDVTDATGPKIISAINMVHETVNLVVVGHRAYVTSATRDESDRRWKTSRLDIIDVQSSSQPVIEGGIDLVGGAWSLGLSGNHVYVGCRRYVEGVGPESIGGRLYAVDVSKPANPTIVGELELPGDAATLSVTRHHVYIAETKFNSEGNFGGGYFQIVDISAPSRPVVTAEVGLTGVGWGIDLVGSTAYVVEAKKRDWEPAYGGQNPRRPVTVTVRRRGRAASVR